MNPSETPEALQASECSELLIPESKLLDLRPALAR
jgi:hypothetical protein